MPILFLILFGIIEFGIAFNDYQSIRQGAREGARQAVVNDYGSDTSCGINGAAAGAPNNAKAIICTTKDRTALGDDVRVGIRVANTDADASFKGDSVQICTIRLVDSVTGFLAPFIDDRPLRTTVVMRVEKNINLPAPPTQTVSYLETDPSGDNWSWC